MSYWAPSFRFVCTDVYLSIIQRHQVNRLPFFLPALIWGYKYLAKVQSGKPTVPLDKTSEGRWLGKATEGQELKRGIDSCTVLSACWQARRGAGSKMDQEQVECFLHKFRTVLWQIGTINKEYGDDSHADKGTLSSSMSGARRGARRGARAGTRGGATARRGGWERRWRGAIKEHNRAGGVWDFGIDVNHLPRKLRWIKSTPEKMKASGFDRHNNYDYNLAIDLSNWWNALIGILMHFLSFYDIIQYMITFLFCWYLLSGERTAAHILPLSQGKLLGIQRSCRVNQTWTTVVLSTPVVHFLVFSNHL